MKVIILILFINSIHLIGKEYKIVLIGDVKNKDTAYVYPQKYDIENYQGFVKDSLPNGKWIAHFIDNSTIAFIGFYKDGKPNGLFQYYYKNGKVRHTCVYKNGIKDGPFTFWDIGGSISMFGQKADDKNDGIWYDWWDNGNLRKFEIWENDLENGKYLYFNSKGILETEGNYYKGYSIGKWQNYHSNGQLKEQQYFIDSILIKELNVLNNFSDTYVPIFFAVGTWKEWDENGNLIMETFYKNYEIDYQIEYYSSGSKKTYTKYEGFHRGICSQNPSYFIKNGLFQEWFESGQLKTTGKWLNDEKEGEWIFQSENGTILKKEFYMNGRIKNN